MIVHMLLYVRDVTLLQLEITLDTNSRLLSVLTFDPTIRSRPPPYADLSLFVLPDFLLCCRDIN